MKALCWHGREDIRCETVPDPKILDDRDAIIKVTSCAICGSDLHLNCNIQHGDRWQRPYAQTVQTHVQKYPAPLMKLIEDGKIDPSFLITHRINISDGPETYRTFRDKKDGCIKVVIKPNG